MEMFFRSETHLLSKAEICDALWPKKPDASDTLYTLIRRLKPIVEAHSDLKIEADRGKAYELKLSCKTLAAILLVSTCACRCLAQTETQVSMKEGVKDTATIPMPPLQTTPEIESSNPTPHQSITSGPFPNSLQRSTPTANLHIPKYRPTTTFGLWEGASLTADGYQKNQPGLMGMSRGALTLRQDFGRLHLSASGLANKYWMPGINSMIGPIGVPMLHTQWGFSGTLSYEVSPALSLHAFGTYYATNPLVGAAISPYISTTRFGGFADISINEHFGSYVGAQRYLNPISGKWTTDPIVTPYIKVGKHNKSRIEFPVGQILKTLIWGDQYNPMRFRPLPPRLQPVAPAPSPR